MTVSSHLLTSLLILIAVQLSGAKFWDDLMDLYLMRNPRSEWLRLHISTRYQEKSAVKNQENYLPVSLHLAHRALDKNGMVHAGKMKVSRLRR